MRLPRALSPIVSSQVNALINACSNETPSQSSVASMNCALWTHEGWPEKTVNVYRMIGDKPDRNSKIPLESIVFLIEETVSGSKPNQNLKKTLDVLMPLAKRNFSIGDKPDRNSSACQLTISLASIIILAQKESFDVEVDIGDKPDRNGRAGLSFETNSAFSRRLIGDKPAR